MIRGGARRRRGLADLNEVSRPHPAARVVAWAPPAAPNRPSGPPPRFAGRGGRSGFGRRHLPGHLAGRVGDRGHVRPATLNGTRLRAIRGGKPRLPGSTPATHGAPPRNPCRRQWRAAKTVSERLRSFHGPRATGTSRRAFVLWSRSSLIRRESRPPRRHAPNPPAPPPGPLCPTRVPADVIRTFRPRTPGGAESRCGGLSRSGGAAAAAGQGPAHRSIARRRVR